MPSPALLATCNGTPAATLVAALPQTVNLVIYVGDDFWLDLAVTDTNGTTVDLSGSIPAAQIRSKPGAADPPMCTFDAAIDTVNSSVIHLHLTAVESAKLAGPAVWDAQVATNTVPSLVTTLVAGRVTTCGQVTQ